MKIKFQPCVQYLFVFSVMMLMLVMTACGGPAEQPSDIEQAPSNAKPEAEKSESVQPCEKCVISLSPANTEIAFTGRKVVGHHDGVFKSHEGTLRYPDNRPEGAQIDVTIDLKSVKTDSEKLDGHLQAKDFFYVEKFPNAKFVSTQISPKSGDVYNVTGDFTLRGVTKQIAFEAKLNRVGNNLKATANFQINRQDYDVAFAGMPDNLIDDMVEIRLSIDAPIL